MPEDPKPTSPSVPSPLQLPDSMAKDPFYAAPVTADRLSADPLSPESPIPFDIGEEYGTASKNLPPIKIVLVCLAIVGVIAVILVLMQRPHSATTGSIDDIVSVEVPNQNFILVAINLAVQNQTEKPYWIRSITADVDTGSNHYTDEAAAVVDLDRYFKAFPPLKEHALPPLARETKIDPKTETKGTIVVSFPITPQAFANRKSLKITIQPYDQRISLILVK
ncbi:MAG: hypothetical protein NVS1B11_00720 [Terriglobales bacterium]